MADDFTVLGIDPAHFSNAAAPGGLWPEDGIWPENAAALDAFLAITSQWRVIAGAAGPLIYSGLDYAGARAGLELAGIAISPALWADVQVIEAGALGALNRRRN